MTAQFEPIELLHVELALKGKPRTVGRLARQNRQIYFEYDPEFLAEGFALSPFKLPLQVAPRLADLGTFEGLHGVFNDSLPDGWGRLLLDRRLSARGGSPSALTPLDRLAYVGNRGLGALCYRPIIAPQRGPSTIDLDALAEEIHQVLEGHAGEVLDQLLELGGSSGGARPKVLLGCDERRAQLRPGVGDLPAGFSHWLVKFRSSSDPLDIGAIEYAYSEMVRAAGIEMEPTHLFPADKGPGYFGTRRFDRRGKQRFHVHTICGLLHADHRLPTIGYETVLKATRMATRNQVEVDQMFRRMVFNVLAYNRDDHTKNHALMLDEANEWRCTPVYDVTFSSGPGGEHALALVGEGRRPGLAHIEQVARQVGVSPQVVRSCLDGVRAAIDRWPAFASAAGVTRAQLKKIDAQLNGLRPAAKPKSAAKQGLATKRARLARASKAKPKSAIKTVVAKRGPAAKPLPPPGKRKAAAKPRARP